MENINNKTLNPWFPWVKDPVLLRERIAFWQWYITLPLLILSFLAYLYLADLLPHILNFLAEQTYTESSYLNYLNSEHSFFNPENIYSFIMPFITSLVLIMLVIITLSIRARKLTFGLTYYGREIVWSHFWKATAALSIIFSLNIAFLHSINGDHLHLQPFNTKMVTLLIIALFILLIQAFSEELLYRGFLLRTLGAIFPVRLVAIGLVLALFALHHHYTHPDATNIWKAITFFMTSELLYFWLLFRTGSIMATLGLRWVNNSLFAIIITIQVPELNNLSLLRYSQSFTNIQNGYFDTPVIYVLQFLGAALFLTLILWNKSPLHIASTEEKAEITQDREPQHLHHQPAEQERPQ